MGVEFYDYSEEVKAKIENALIAGLYEAAGEIESEVISSAKRNSDSGQTRESWQYKVIEHEFKAVIGNPLENAIWEEFGTGEFALHGNGRKGAWYVPVDGYTGKKKPTFNGKVVVVYGKNGKQFYKTNGKKPRRYLQSAFNSKKNTAIKLIQNKLKQALKD